MWGVLSGAGVVTTDDDRAPAFGGVAGPGLGVTGAFSSPPALPNWNAVGAVPLDVAASLSSEPSGASRVESSALDVPAATREPSEDLGPKAPAQSRQGVGGSGWRETHAERTLSGPGSRWEKPFRIHVGPWWGPAWALRAKRL